MLIKIKAPKGGKLRDIATGYEYSEVICDEKYRNRYVLVDGEDDPVVETIDGVPLANRVSDLEDAIVELAELYAEQDDAIVELAGLIE